MRHISIVLSTIITAIVLTSCGRSNKTITAATPTPLENIKEKATTVVKEEIPEAPKAPENTKVVAEKIEMIKETPAVEIPTPEVIEVVKDKVETTIPSPTIAYPNHNNFGNLLARHVSSQGNVNYNGFKSNWNDLRAYIKELGEITPTDEWSNEDKLAYWMNAYNAMTVDLILRNQPISSIKDIKDPWGQRLWKLGSKWYNLNQIEHEILRKMGDARIHFGINCASFSCPPLSNEAFTADKVDNQLEQLAKAFVNDTKRNTITANSIKISKIFSWFSKDFKTNGSVIDFLNKYSGTHIASNAKKGYRDYNWTLNK